ncbi:MAG: hypothetical protein JRF33_14985 [Deltaproteobacteria bacterium]|nr:hypothetical protein [Deltaproteobacteria bacterium]
MSTCPIQSSEKLRALLSGQLDEPLATELRKHLQTDCEHCLNFFEEIDEGELLEWSAGPATLLNATEADAMFDAANPQKKAPWLSRLFHLPVLVPAASLAAILLIILFIAPWGSDPKPDEMGIKAAGQESPIRAQLMGIIGQIRNGQPLAVQRAQSVEPLLPGQVLMLRYHIDRPAWIYLLAQDGNRVSWLHSEQNKVEAGDHEVQAAGQALAIPAEKLGRGLRIILLACPEQRNDAKDIAGPGALSQQGAFKTCGKDSLRFTFRDAQP